MLTPGRNMQKNFGSRIPSIRGAGNDQFPDCLCARCSTRLARDHNVDLICIGDPGCQTPGLGRLAGPLPSFKGDQPASPQSAPTSPKIR